MAASCKHEFTVPKIEPRRIRRDARGRFTGVEEPAAVPDRDDLCDRDERERGTWFDEGMEPTLH